MVLQNFVPAEQPEPQIPEANLEIPSAVLLPLPLPLEEELQIREVEV